MPKVSIIIPIYNVKKYLRLSVESAMSQTENDIEVILVDDGSTDGSSGKCDEYAKTDKRIKVIHKENGGLSSARNTGVLISSAPYILLLDGDDYLHAQAVERLLEIESEYPSDIIQFQYKEVDEVMQLPDLLEKDVSFQSHSAEQAFIKLYELGGVGASGCTKLFRRQLLVDIPFETIRHEDEMWCTRAFPRNLTITYISDILYGYVVRSGSIIHSAFCKNRLDIFKIKEERISILQQFGFSKLEKEEWNRLFSTIFLLYKDAKEAHDYQSQNIILTYFRESSILKKAVVIGKMKLFKYIAMLNKKISLDIYAFYWRLK